MSTELHNTMLYFKGHTLIAKHDGVGLELTALPLMPDIPPSTTELYFYPALSEYRLKENTKPERDMRAPEIEACVKILNALADFGRRLLKGTWT